MRRVPSGAAYLMRPRYSRADRSRKQWVFIAGGISIVIGGDLRLQYQARHSNSHTAEIPTITVDQSHGI